MPVKETLAQLVEELRQAADERRIAKLEQVCDRIMLLVRQSDRPVPTADGKAILGILRSARRFSTMQQLAEELIRDGSDDPVIIRQYAQSLIDSGRIMPAIGVLESLLGRVRPADGKETHPECAEVYGLLGRSWKDIAVQAAGRAGRQAAAKAALQRSYDYYRQGLELNREANLIWHGINLVALSGLAKRHKLALDGELDLADDIKSAIARIPDGRKQPWDFATMGEALVAKGEIGNSVAWFETYAEKADAFALAGTIRQLQDIWRIQDQAEGNALLVALRGQQLRKIDGNMQLSAKELQSYSDTLQANFGGPQPAPVLTLKAALESARSVACIRYNTRPIGTGFVVRLKDTGLGDSDEKVIVTNCHVVCDDPEYYPPTRPAAPPGDVMVTFELHDPFKFFRVEKIIGKLPVRDHDISVLRTSEPLPDGVPSLHVSSWVGGDANRKVFIVGHPGGRELAFSIEDNQVLDFDRAAEPGRPCRIHYRTPTEYGSSGSPVFNENWSVVAVHHAGADDMPRLNGGSDTYAANEGIAFNSIVAAFKAIKGLSGNS